MRLLLLRSGRFSNCPRVFGRGGRPDAGKGCTEIVHHRLSATPQHLGEVTAVHQMITDPRAEGL